jgi:hypothetical protein
MNLRKIILAVSLFIAITSVKAQTIQFGAKTTAVLQHHIQTLASDKFEGRETGTQGEKLSYEYIEGVFKDYGLAPKGTDGYLQSFQFNAGTDLGDNNHFSIGDNALKCGEDYYPLPYSKLESKVEGSLITVGSGIVAPSLNRDDYSGLNNLKGKIFVMDYATPEADNPHSKWAEFANLRKRIDDAITKGAVAVIFYNSSKDVDNPRKESEIKITPASVPVVFVNENKSSLLNAGKFSKIQTDIKKITRTGYNVISYINNNKEFTIVIGAHYDHLGYGGHESLYRGGKAIHNGADDNASGTAALLELARIIKNSSLKNYNFLFIAFSGEEKGLLGSNHFVKEPTIDLSKVNFMINMDMVGRLKPEDQVLLINGVGTSPSWNALMKNISIDSLKIKTTESGVGPSDHTSFYLSNIPVLHFFSGTHSDYHKPSDDEPLINYSGMIKIMKYIVALITEADSLPRFAFTKTNDSNNEEAPRFKVTLGVVPDYAFEGSGMRIDGVTEEKPAAKAGLQKGDIVIQLGDEKVMDMMSYMKALSKFKKGDTTKVKVLRDNSEVEREITF